MPNILYGNFEFEHELESAAYRPAARIEAMSGQLVPHLISLAGDGDSLWSPVEIPRSFLTAAARAGLPDVRCGGSEEESRLFSSETLKLVPWGFSEASVRLARKSGWQADGPAVEFVRKVNDREFSFDVETSLNCGLSGAAAVSSHEEFLQAVRSAAASSEVPDAEQRWALKSRFGMASRARVLGTGTQLDDPSAGWLWKQFAKNGRVIFEPWVECDREFSTQWLIPQGDESISLRGWTEIQTERAGTPSGWLRYLGVPFADSEFQSTLPVLKATVERVADAGYFGPIGVDSMRFRPSDSTVSLRPVQDVNARYTMGRVALELADRLAPDADAAWLHASSRKLSRILIVNSAQDASALYSEQGLDISTRLREAGWPAGSQRTMPGDARAWLTSPLWIGNVLTHRCGILIASRETSKLTELFRDFEMLPRGNTHIGSDRRT
ncbi:MAG: hypothetical protein O2820_17755 [Planctomycetota bacterium]|nr:hypothetical protein [Planctomycetota bacterium]